MTQPETVDPGLSTGTKIIAGSALALALLSIEQQARDDITNTVENLYKGLAAAALLTASAAPATVITGLALISLPSFHRSTTMLFDSAQRKITDTVRSSYQAAAQVAHTKLAAELPIPAEIPDLGTTLDTLYSDINTMFGDARIRLRAIVQAAFRPDDPHALLGPILDSDDNLTNRATAAATTAVHRASADVHQAVFHDLQLQTGQALLKRWRTTSTNPCGMCQALDGTEVGINAEFNTRASTTEKDLRPAWRGHLSGPPRHPNCRCQLELVAVPR